MHLDLARAVVRLMVDGVGDDLAAERLSDVSHVLVVKAQDGVAAGLDVFQKFAKCLANVRERAVVIEMIVLDVRDDGDVRPELQERAVTLISFGDEILALAELRVAAEDIDLAADDDRRRDARMVERDAEHRGRRRLAVRSRHSDALRRIEERGIDVRAMEATQAKPRRLNDLGIRLRNRRRDDDGFCPMHVL